MVGSEDPKLNQGGVDIQIKQNAKKRGNGGLLGAVSRPRDQVSLVGDRVFDASIY